ncbi:MAG: GNAT family N-acetyltransferase [Acidimicrobiales bacterium]
MEAFSDPDIQHWHFRSYDTDAEALAWIKACSEGWRAERSATWAIIWRSTAEIVGRVTIFTSLEDGYGEVSYWVLPHARRRGIPEPVGRRRWARAAVVGDDVTPLF